LLKCYDEYIQKLLIAQFEVSEIIEHNLTKGEIREDFLKKIIVERLPKYRAINGIIVDEDGKQSSQCDCILLDVNSQTRKLGKQEIVDIDDVLYVIEIKSNIKGADLTKFNADIDKIKEMKHSNEKMKFIMFGYKINLKHKTVLKRFKHDVNADTQVIYFEESNSEFYPNIDVLVSLDDCNDLQEIPDKNKQFAIQRFEKQAGVFEYFYQEEHPIIIHLFGLLK
jgi:tRNA G10  N-methylase Trm11